MKTETKNLLTQVARQFGEIEGYREARYRELVDRLVAGVDDDVTQMALLDAVQIVEATGRTFQQFEADVAAGRVGSKPHSPGAVRCI